MSDLSRLLDDVYRSGTPAAVPSWSSDRALDDAFEHWVPGPPADAPEDERSYAGNWAEVPGNVPEAAVAFAEALDERQTVPPADPFAPLHALLDEAIRRAAEADAGTETAAEPAVDAEPEPEVGVVVPELVPPTAPAVREPQPLGEATVEAPEDVDVVASALVAPVPVARWTRSDDDILPAGRTGRGVRLLRRRR